MEGIWKARKHSALRLDGRDDYCDCGNDESLNFGTSDFTLEGWIKIGDPMVNVHISLKQDTLKDYESYGLKVVDGTVDFYTRLSGTTNHLYGGVIDTNWHHVVGVFDRDVGKRLYVDGIEVNRNNYTDATDINNNAPFLVGTARAVDYWFPGLIASHRIYSRALSDSEIKYLYYNPDDPLDTDHLVLWLHPGSIDTDAGYWWDISGNDNHGQIFGATKVSLVSPEVTVL